MSLKLNGFSTKTAGLLCAGLLLTGCNSDFSLSELGEKLDRNPTNAPEKVADDRPDADENGVISYPNYQVVVAREGDTVSTVADRIGIEPTRLARYNGLTVGKNLRNGEVLALPNGFVAEGTSLGGNSIESIASSALDDAPETTRSTSVDPVEEPVRHVVRNGETAYSIARLYNVSVTALASWNGLDSQLSVRNGQRLLIPTGTPAAQPDAVSKPGSGSATPNPPSGSEPLPKPQKPKVIPKPQPEPKPEPAPAKPAPSSFSAPVTGKILRGFSSASGGNEGIDYAAPVGTEVRAAGSGTVALISKSVGDTTIVLLRHPNNLYTVYSNVTNVALRKGNKVSKGGTIGVVAGGNPPYVHFEIRKGTEAVDPTPYLK